LSGIAYFGQATGVARENNCLRNGHHGITVNDEAEPSLEANTCNHNEQNGIAYFGSAGGAAVQNQCVYNEGYGIFVGDEAQPVLKENTCCENKRSPFSREN